MTGLFSNRQVHAEDHPNMLSNINESLNESHLLKNYQKRGDEYEELLGGQEHAKGGSPNLTAQYSFGKHDEPHNKSSF